MVFIEVTDCPVDSIGQANIQHGLRTGLCTVESERGRPDAGFMLYYELALQGSMLYENAICDGTLRENAACDAFTYINHRRVNLSRRCGCKDDIPLLSAHLHAGSQSRVHAYMTGERGQE